jgi:hypothetical protein
MDLILAPELQPLIKWRERVRERFAQDPDREFYVRLRVREPGGPRVFTDQIMVKADAEEAWLQEIADRIESSRLPSPVMVELLPRGGHSAFETVTISPLQEAIEAAVQGSVKRAQIEGESALAGALLEAVLRSTAAREASLDRRELAQLDTVERLTELRIEAARREALDEAGGALVEEEPRDRTIESMILLKETFGPAVAGLGVYLASLAGIPIPERKPPSGKPPAAPPAGPGQPRGAAPPPTPPSAPPPPQATQGEDGAPASIDPGDLADHLLSSIEELATAVPAVITPARKRRIASWVLRFRPRAAEEAPPVEAVPVEEVPEAPQPAPESAPEPEAAHVEDEPPTVIDVEDLPPEPGEGP